MSDSAELGLFVFVIYFIFAGIIGLEEKTWAALRWPIYVAVFVLNGAIKEMHKDVAESARAGDELRKPN